MAGLPRHAHGAPASKQTMRPPPPRPKAPTPTGRAQSPADSIASTTSSLRARSPGVQSNAVSKRKERDFENDDSQETNIHVVVRCRARNDRELRENSGVVVSTHGMKGKSVDLTMGPSALSNKTYHFDKVFSPAADQAIIFDDVVKPFLEEMLQGYNCTIFAYGQTGTGKTYTMSGDMTENMGLLADAAGIIPRVLHSLFQRLEQDGSESSVKCSFIELYNEELRDLLSVEENAKLKIYDDTNKRNQNATTLVHGMEESHIATAAGGINLLQNGSFRRQVAATKCNDLSSRSHTVFTITVYTKRTTDAGEEILSAGKLNLVDLAGSENIQRSGAENKRAAEAGLINKSLLTLGRVINALVDKSSHIPYRESKLTRLLQDSLGGRTKTCIIATVSPAKSNLEETISTLDYAFRAKNIRNKPQVNSMISKKTLLREFTAEIEKLKSELLATRQRNGVYLTSETWDELTAESESRRILIEEQRDRIDTMEVNLRNKVQELYSLTNNFMTLKKDNESTKTAFDKTHDVLKKTEIVLRDTEQNLAEETLLRKAHQNTEAQLQDLGGNLISTIQHAVSDIGALHAKNRRQSDLHHLNRGTWEASAAQVSETSHLVDNKISEFQAEHAKLIGSLAGRIQGFIAYEVQTIEKSKVYLETRLRAFEESKKEVGEQTSKARDEMNGVLEEIKVLREQVKEQVGEGLKGLSAAAERISGEVVNELEKYHVQVHTSYNSIGKEFTNILKEVDKQIREQKQEAESLREELQKANAKIIQVNGEAASKLAATVQEEREASDADRTTLLANIKALIYASAETQEARLTSKLSSVKNELCDSKKVFAEADSKYTTGMNNWSQKEDEIIKLAEDKRRELKARVQSDWNTIGAQNLEIQNTTKSIHEESVRIVDAQMADVATHMAAWDGFVTRARSQNDLHHQSHTSSLEVLGHGVCHSYTNVVNHFSTRSSDLSTFSTEMSTQTADLQSSLSPLDGTVRQPLSRLSQDVERASLTEYTITGETPQKTTYLFSTSLPRTQSHDKLISKLKRSHDVANGDNSSASTRPASASPNKCRSPSKGLVYNDNDDAPNRPNSTSPLRPSSTASDPPRPATALGLREVDANVLAAAEGTTIGMGPPPLKRHATTSAVDSKLPKLGTSLGSSVVRPGGRENQPAGLGARRAK